MKSPITLGTELGKAIKWGLQNYWVEFTGLLGQNLHGLNNWVEITVGGPYMTIEAGLYYGRAHRSNGWSLRNHRVELT